MRKISKGPQPYELAHYRSRPDAVYDGPYFTEVKEKIRISLLAEQGHLCAYCMQRISEGTMKVEHWQCQRHFPERQLDWQNMLGVCPGNQGLPGNSQTCDTRKGDADLCLNPADHEHHARLEICYTRDGRIHSHNAEFDTEISQRDMKSLLCGCQGIRESFGLYGESLRRIGAMFLFLIPRC
ncbi:hypothetical protein QUF80_18595 [Desulfococcaceae bacterium HSG8]|nr:hypothetical protein [Desulfococcaceae bacterium HSG8]